MKSTVTFTDLIVSSSSRRIEIERRIQRLAFELRDEIAELTGTEWRVVSEVRTGFILVTKAMPPANTRAAT